MATVKEIAFEDNPLYPLPPDYNDLSEDGQRQARINATRQWLVRDAAPHDIKARRLTHSMRFFDDYYLTPEDAYFYPPTLWAPSPHFHDHMLSLIVRHRYTVAGAPRGFAKTGFVRKLLLATTLSSPLYQITYASSTNTIVKKTMNALKRQWTRNRYIFDDFAPEYEGRILPRKGFAPFGGGGEIHLNNMSSIFFTSVKAKNRGDRPLLFVLDDPEWDSSASTDDQVKREDMSDFLFDIVMPMVQQEGCRLFWVGTIISRRHYLYMALDKVKDPITGEPVPRDPDFRRWQTLRLKALNTLPDGSEVSLWPEKYPVSELHRIREDMGEARFRAEYQNDPAAGMGSFWLDSTRHSYWLKPPPEPADPHPSPYDNPRESNWLIGWHDDRTNSPVEKPLSEFLQETVIIQTVDSASTISATSDYSASCVMGIHNSRNLFVLDLWADRVNEGALTQSILTLGYKWMPIILGVESAGIGEIIKHRIGMVFRERAEKSGWMPKIIPVSTANRRKEERIGGMAWRFGTKDGHQSSLIKFPFWQQHGGRSLSSSHPWNLLHEQVSDFVAEIMGGGLTHDDCLDALAMHQPIIAKAPMLRPSAPTPKDDLQMAMEGNLYDKDRWRLQGFQIDKLPGPILQTIINKQREKAVTQPQSLSEYPNGLPDPEDPDNLI
jgi:hypothetical protein